MYFKKEVINIIGVTMNIIEKLESKMKGYYYKPLNLNEFINYFKLDMMLNNNLIYIDGLDFELYNYDELYNYIFNDLELKDHEEEIKEIINEEIPNDEKIEILTALKNNDKETISLLNESISNYINEVIDDELYYNDVYQYFIIPDTDISLWEKYTNYPIYEEYNKNIYLVGITHFGISWNRIQTDYKEKCYI